jgi:hypothetical protein
MIKYIVFILLTALSASWAAVTTAPRRGPEGNRFLFIVDTSSSMKRIEQAGRQVVFDLVNSGIEGRMQPGDTFGVWTFEDDVKGGVFPIQVWTPEKSSDLAGQVGRFLKEELGGRASRLDVAITNAERLVKSVRDVDIVIVTSSGTRFKPDETWAILEQNWKGRLEEAQKNKKAMVITLACRSGRMAQATVALQGERLNLAAPPERRPAPMAKAEPAPEPPPKPVRDPIIMRGTPKARPIDDIPTRFSPPPTAPAPEPVENPIPEPAPVPVLTPANPVVSTSPAREPQPEMTVSARQPGTSPQSAPMATKPGITLSPRMLIIAGASLMLIAGVLGTWMLLQARARNRVSYISRSLANKP